jgi:hypothetical protein
LFAVLAREEPMTHALPHVPVKLPVPRTIAGTELGKVKFVGDLTLVSLEPLIADTFTKVTKPVTIATRVNTGHCGDKEMC